MPEVLAALDAFLQEHRRGGELDGGVVNERVWMTCDWGAVLGCRAEPGHPTRGADNVAS